MRRNRPSAISAAICNHEQLLSPRRVRIHNGAPLKDDIEKAGERFAARFERNVNRGEGCHEWTASLNPNGYGRISLNGRTRLAHRVAWVMANGRDIPDQMVVCHKCDNRRCVRAGHLWIGTAAENLTDMYAKGRGFSTRHHGGAVMLAEQIPQFVSHKERFK